MMPARGADACNAPGRRALAGLVLLAALALALAAAPAPPSRAAIETIYVMPSSHWDLGFLAPPEEILARVKPHLDEVIANARADPEFRWTVESAWQVQEWLARTEDKALVEDFARRVRSGQIQLSAVFGSVHSEYLGAEQLNRLVYDMKELERRLGVTTELAMMNDVPGFTLRLPQVLARSGVRYFLNGSNLFIGGGTALGPGRMPFYWEGPDGSRVLTWQTQSRFGGYTEALADYWLDPATVEPYTREAFFPKELQGRPALEVMEAGVAKLLQQYGDAGYPYDAVLVMYLHDFLSSNRVRDSLLPAVRAWNAAGKRPLIRVATPAEFFGHLETKYAGRFGVWRGDWSGLWSEVKTNSPRISARVRWGHNHLPVAELLWSFLSFREGTGFPAGNLEQARRAMLKYDEHSGAGQVGWPKLMSREQTERQNREYAGYARTSRAALEQLLEQGMQTLFSQTGQGAATHVVVFNPLSWPRTDVACAAGAFPEPFRLVEAASGREAPSERSGADRICFLAEEVPGVGYRTYRLEPAEGRRDPPASFSAGGNAIENAHYRVEWRTADGAITRIYDKGLVRELVPEGAALGALGRWTYAANLPVPLGAVTFAVRQGPLAAEAVIRRPGTFWPETRIALSHAGKRLEISNRLERARMPFVASLQHGENYSFEFPFRFDGPATVWVDSGAGHYRVPEDQLPGARADAAVTQGSLLLAGTAGGGPATVTLSTREAFFAYLPALPDQQGRRVFLNTVRVQAVRNQTQGETRDLGFYNFAGVEPGMEDVPLELTVVITSAAGPPDFVASYRRGRELNVPLLAAALLPSLAPEKPAGWFWSVSAENVALLAFKPSANGSPEHFTLRLQEIAGRAAEAVLETPLAITAAEETSMTEDPLASRLPVAPLRVRLTPYQTLTLRLTIPHAARQRSHRWWEWN